MSDTNESYVKKKDSLNNLIKMFKIIAKTSEAAKGTTPTESPAEQSPANYSSGYEEKAYNLPTPIYNDDSEEKTYDLREWLNYDYIKKKEPGKDPVTGKDLDYILDDIVAGFDNPGATIGGGSEITRPGKESGIGLGDIEIPEKIVDIFEDDIFKLFNEDDDLFL
jgi:hypothetical protein